MKDTTFIWAVASVLIVSTIAYWTAQFNMETERQSAFMMKACVDAGGQSKKNWGPTWDCIRPEDRP
jgi:hypothetical protein